MANVRDTFIDKYFDPIPRLMLPRPTIKRLAEIGELSEPRIIYRNGEFVPILRVGETDVIIENKTGFPVSFSTVKAARNTMMRLGFRLSEIVEGQLN